MKKRTKILITAAAVAAVVGVSAVSFAYWSGSTKTSVTVTGTTGVINTLGDLTVTPKEGTYNTEDNAIVMNALYPVDQTTGNGLPTGGLTYWEFTLSTAQGTGDQTVSYKLAGSLTKDGGIGSAKLYWTTSDPTAEDFDAENDGTLVSADADDLTNVENGGTVYVYMTANATDAMEASISLTFSQH
ncbi:MAG: hypothetical protein K2O04_03045 [Clostridiales bacterium]|nr:hypothetical protein [Clostridiales bacterium]